MSVDNINPKSQYALRGGRFLVRHLPFLMLLAVLIYHMSQTFGLYFWHDDIHWLRSTVANVHRPWEIFGDLAYGPYVRPAFSAAWLGNYYVWGFNAFGYQLTLVLVWLAGVVLVYSAGCRIGGRLTGWIAATLLGLNHVWLLMAAWKSWYGALLEFGGAAGWLLCYVAWLEGRKTRHLVGWLAFGLLGTFAKESIPLIICAGTFVTLVWPRLCRGRAVPADEESVYRARRSWGPLLIWVGVFAAVFMALPAYRDMVWSALAGGDAPLAPGAEKSFSLAYFWPRFQTHSTVMIESGISRYLLIFALIASAWRHFEVRRRWPQASSRAFLGALLGGTIFVSLPMGMTVWGAEAELLTRMHIWPVMYGLLFAAFVILALQGDRWDRLLAIWFCAAMAPILFFRLGSNAYHMVAFSALALYVARSLAAFIATDVAPLWKRTGGRTSAMRCDTAQGVALVLLIAAGALQAALLCFNFRAAHGDGMSSVTWRVNSGKQRHDAVRHAVAEVLADSAPQRHVWVDGDDREWLAALELQERHGFQVKILPRDGPPWVGLRRFDSPVRIYTDAMPFDEASPGSMGRLIERVRAQDNAGR